MRRYSFLLIPVIFLAMAAALPAGGEKELIIRLQGEVMVLNRQVRDLQESFDKAQGQNAPMVQKISDNSENTLRALSTIEESLKSTQTTQINTLTGTNATNTRINKLSEQAAAADQRINQILTQINSLKSFVEKQQNCIDKNSQAEAAPNFDNAEQLYAFAYGQFVKKNFDQAATYFQKYIDAYSATEAADNAQFWIGECFYNQAKYDDAVRAYDKVITDHPKSDKLAAAFLKKGLTLLRLERRDDGVTTLRAVISQFPRSQEAAAATEELNRLGEPLQSPVVPPGKPASRSKNPRTNP